jgi:HlyD family secretion protein
MQDVKTTEAAPGSDPLAPPAPKLPAPIAAGPPAIRRRWGPALPVLLLLAGVALAGAYWWQLADSGLPAGIASGNGRIEADEIDIATKFAGRIAELYADEGDTVKQGQALARMDTSDLEASLAKAEAVTRQADAALASARADAEQQRSQLRFAEQQLARSRYLVQKDFASQEILNQRQSLMDAAKAALDAAEARAVQAEHAAEAARHDAELIRVNIADNLLAAPKDGRIQYRLAKPGEVLGAGGKVFTMLDSGYIYMDVFLPTAEAGRLGLGAEARIVLDALPDRPIPAKVIFVADQAQFTPKLVETKSERDKLMFRVRVRVDADFVDSHANAMRAGQPGVGYLRLDPALDWPPTLQPKS